MIPICSKPRVMSNLICLLVTFFFFSCRFNNDQNSADLFSETKQQFAFVKEIPPPEGYKRIKENKDSFGEWLKDIQLKKDDHVYLYDGSLKKRQCVQFAVLDISVGKKDLQQCADAVMRLRAEYLFSHKRFDEIAFTDNNGRSYSWKGKDNRIAFDKYLENVFSWCGTASLEKQLRPVENINDIKPGDVFIKGGFPGHAMIVMDVAISKEGKKLFMLAQSYMPAQDIHIVKNPVNEKLSPWYELNDDEDITTPEWIFNISHLRTW